MLYNLQTQNLELTATDQQMLDDKLNRFQKFLKEPYQVDIRFVRDTHHNSGLIMNCLINIRQGKNVFHAERVAATVQDSLDQCLDGLKQEVAKNRDKCIQARRVIKRIFRR